MNDNKDSRGNHPANRDNRSLREGGSGSSDINLYTEERIDLFDFPKLTDYWDILLRRKWLIIVCVMVSLAAVLFYTALQTPVYKATASIEIMPGMQKITSFKKESEFDPAAQNLDEYYETQYKLIKSRSLAGNVVDKLDIVPAALLAEKKKNDVPGFMTILKSSVADFKGLLNIGETEAKDSSVGLNPERSVREREDSKRTAVSDFVRSIEISPDRKSRLAEVSYLSIDPEFSAKAVNTLVDEYSLWMIDRRIEATRSAREFLEEQIRQAKARLERSEEQLSKFAKKVDIVSLDKDLNLVFKQLSQLNEAYAEAETERVSKESLYREIQKGNYYNLPQVVNNESLQELKDRYTELNAQYDRLSVTYGPNYPDIKQLKAQMQAVKSDIDAKTNSIASSIKRDYEAALEKEKMLRERNEEQNERASVLNEKTIQYNILEREVETNEEIYNSLLQRYKETEIASAVKTTPINVVDYANVPVLPFSPSWAFNIMLGLFFGLVAGGSSAIVAEHFDNAIRDEDEVKDKYPITYLGAVPYYNNEDDLLIEKIVYTHPRSIVAEAYRVIRTSLFFSFPETDARTVLIASSQPLEGKSTTTSNLAIAVSKFRQRVVIVDADMRRPRMQDLYLSSRNLVGLSSFLINKASVEEVTYSTDVEGVDVVPTGILPPNPAELIGSGRMKELLDILKERYDYVFVDAPPLAAFADSRLLSTYVDGMILVTSVGITQRSILKDVINDLYQVRANVIGAIVNRMVPSRNKYSYYYHYYMDESGNERKPNIRISSSDT